MSEPSVPPPPYTPPPTGTPPVGTPPPSPPAGPGSSKIGAWFSQAVEIVKPNWVDFLLAIVVAYLTILVAEFLCFVPVLIVIGPISAGIYIYSAKRVLGLPAEVADIFKGFRRTLDTFILGLIVFLLPIVFITLSFLPHLMGAFGSSLGPLGRMFAGISASLGCLLVPLSFLFAFVYPLLASTFLVFALPLILFRAMPVMDAMKKSIEIVKGDFFTFFLLLLFNSIVMIVAQIAGGILLCIGTLVVVPLAMGVVVCTHVLAYRDYLGLKPEDLAPYAN
jgi:uncharacterized membrane protein